MKRIKERSKETLTVKFDLPGLLEIIKNGEVNEEQKLLLTLLNLEFPNQIDEIAKTLIQFLKDAPRELCLPNKSSKILSSEEELIFNTLAKNLSLSLGSLGALPQSPLFSKLLLPEELECMKKAYLEESIMNVKEKLHRIFENNIKEEQSSELLFQVLNQKTLMGLPLALSSYLFGQQGLGLFRMCAQDRTIEIDDQKVTFLAPFHLRYSYTSTEDGDPVIGEMKFYFEILFPTQDQKPIPSFSYEVKMDRKFLMQNLEILRNVGEKLDYIKRAEERLMADIKKFKRHTQDGKNEEAKKNTEGFEKYVARLQDLQAKWSKLIADSTLKIDALVYKELAGSDGVFQPCDGDVPPVKQMKEAFKGARQSPKIKVLNKNNMPSQEIQDIKFVKMNKAKKEFFLLIAEKIQEIERDISQENEKISQGKRSAQIEKPKTLLSSFLGGLLSSRSASKAISSLSKPLSKTNSLFLPSESDVEQAVQLKEKLVRIVQKICIGFLKEVVFDPELDLEKAKKAYQQVILDSSDGTLVRLMSLLEHIEKSQVLLSNIKNANREEMKIVQDFYKRLDEANNQLLEEGLSFARIEKTIKITFSHLYEDCGAELFKIEDTKIKNIISDTILFFKNARDKSSSFRRVESVSEVFTPRGERERSDSVVSVESPRGSDASPRPPSKK